MSIVIILSVFNGFSELAQNRFSCFNPPYKLEFSHNESGSLSLQDVEALGSGIGAQIFKTIETRGYLTTEEGGTVASIIGVPDDWCNISGIGDVVIAGLAFVGDTLGAQWGITGSGVAQRLGLWQNGQLPVKISIPRREGRINPGSLLSAFKSDTVYVAGFFSVTDPTVDDDVIVVSSDMAERLGGSTAPASLFVYPQKDFKLKELKKYADVNGMTLLDIRHQNMEAFRMINIEKWISFVLLAFILVIATFNIVSVLTMLIIEKRSNMSILRAMGMTRMNIRSIFVWEGALLSLSGGLAGTVLGVLLVICQKVFGWVKIGSDIDPSLMSISVYPVELSGTDFLTVGVLILILSSVVAIVSIPLLSKK